MVKSFKVNGYSIPITFDSNGDNKLQVSELNIWCKANDMKYENGKIKSTIPYNAENAPEKFNSNKYSLENLKKRYPESKYKIEVSGNNSQYIEITHRLENKSILIAKEDNGNTYILFSDGDNWSAAEYNKSGNLQWSKSKLNGNLQEHSPLTGKLRQDICQKNSWGLPTTGKNFGSHIKSINSENVAYTLNEYKDKYDTTLISDIFGEIGLDAQTRANYAKHIVDKLCEKDGDNEEVQAIKNQLYQAINHERDKTGTMDSTEIDKLIEILLKSGLSKKKLASARLAHNLNQDVSTKDNIGLPTTGKNLGKHVKNITSENVVSVMKAYEEQHKGKTLLADIIEERGLKTDTRKAYITHIVKAYLDYGKEKGINVNDLEQKFNKEIKYQMDKIGFANADYLNTFVEQLKDRIKAGSNENTSITKPNGKIDEDFEQGNTGDCWLLASIKAIASRPKGLQILNDSVKVNNDGSVTVTLKGVNKTYTISKEELESNIQLSTGDGDIRALEIAVNKYFEEERGVRDRLDINGNNMFVAYDILTGQGDFDHFFPHGSSGDRLINPDYYDHEFTDDEINQFNDKNKIFTVSARGNKDRIVLDSSSSEQVLTTNHAYAVIRSDSEYVYLVNPWNSGSELKVTREQFKEFFNNINEMEL